MVCIIGFILSYFGAQIILIKKLVMSDRKLLGAAHQSDFEIYNWTVVNSRLSITRGSSYRESTVCFPRGKSLEKKYDVTRIQDLKIFLGFIGQVYETSFG